MNLKYRPLWLCIGGLYSILIIYLCLRPSSGAEAFFAHIDKVYHFSAHFFLTWWFAGLFKNRTKIVLYSVLLGAAIEYMQKISGYRSAEMNDAIANLVGAVVGVMPFMPKLPNFAEKILLKLKTKSS